MIYDPSRPENHIYNGIIVPMEFWAPVTEEMVPGVLPIYWISNLGNLYNSETGRYSNAKIKVGDYIRVLLCCKNGEKRMTTIHRLVCMAFNGLPPGPDYNVDHINCDKTCSIYLNLEWVTVGENNRRAHDNDLCKIAEDHYHALFTNEQVHSICRMLSEGVPINTIASIMEEAIYPKQASYKMTDIIYNILRRNSYKSISKDYVFHDYSRIHLTDDEIHKVCISLVNGKSYDFIIDEVLNKKDCDEVERSRLKETMYQIKRGKSFTRISSDYGFTDPEIRKQIMKNSTKSKRHKNDYSPYDEEEDDICIVEEDGYEDFMSEDIKTTMNSISIGVMKVTPKSSSILSKNEISIVNKMITDGKSYDEILLALGPRGSDISVMSAVCTMMNSQGQNVI